MKKYSREIILTAYILVCTVCTFGCGKIQNYDDISEQDSEQSEGSVYAETDRTQDKSDATPEQDDEQEENKNYYANPQGNRITYADGYYYASQLDNYFLYRVKKMEAMQNVWQKCIPAPF